MRDDLNSFSKRYAKATQSSLEMQSSFESTLAQAYALVDFKQVKNINKTY
jgi:hypothetical protein